ncbi:MAG: family 10 glycosylhydrolase, partial [Candidatus Izimaplasma sp.]|nr:family 10 glycosylhydrolase [Candidatus Izimaplasma bacterium]
MSEYLKKIKRFESEELVDVPKTFINHKDEVRAMWVATVTNIDTVVSKDVEDFKKQYMDIVNSLVEAKMNMIIFQVRPTNDAYYDSLLNPYSQYLFGEEGKSLGFDPLKFMTKVAHENNLEFHAWLNPYRVAKSSDNKTTVLNSLHVENYARQNPELVIPSNVDSNGNFAYILNPGEPEVKVYIRNVVMELMTMYDIDGIHFDD